MHQGHLSEETKQHLGGLGVRCVGSAKNQTPKLNPPIRAPPSAELLTGGFSSKHRLFCENLLQSDFYYKRKPLGIELPKSSCTQQSGRTEQSKAKHRGAGGAPNAACGLWPWTGTLGADVNVIISLAIMVLLKLAHAVRFLSCNGFIFFSSHDKNVLSIIFRT